jgi:hypothetical protein
MPGARLERLAVLLGLIALAGVVVLGIRGWQRYERGGVETPTHAATRRPIAPAARTVPRPRGTLVLQAVAGDSWAIVRSARATGEVLYDGIVARGRSVSFSGRRFWLRIGAAGNVQLRFDGRPLAGFPLGTVTLAIDGRAVRMLG